LIRSGAALEKVGATVCGHKKKGDFISEVSALGGAIKRLPDILPRISIPVQSTETVKAVMACELIEIQVCIELHVNGWFEFEQS
jgi:hypothetical protein